MSFFPEKVQEREDSEKELDIPEFDISQFLKLNELVEYEDPTNMFQETDFFEWRDNPLKKSISFDLG